MYKKVTKPQIKEMLKKSNVIELFVHSRGKDPNHFMTNIMEIKITNIEETKITNIEELDTKVIQEWRKISDTSQIEYAIWIDD